MNNLPLASDPPVPAATAPTSVPSRVQATTPVVDARVEPGDSRSDISSVIASLQQRLLRAVVARSSDSLAAAVRAVATMLVEVLHPRAIDYFSRDDEEKLVPLGTLFGVTDPEILARMRPITLDAAQRACQTGTLAILPEQPSPETVAVAVPVILRAAPPEALVVLMPASDAIDDARASILELAATHLTLWHVLQDCNTATEEARILAALVEILDTTARADDPTEAVYHLASEIATLLDAPRVAIAFCQGHANACRLQALSGAARFDRRTESVRSLEAAMDEAIRRDRISVWPNDDDADRHGLLAHKTAATVAGATRAISSPLRDEDGELLGAWMVLGDDALDENRTVTHFLVAASAPVAAMLALARRAEPGRLGRLVAMLRRLLGATWYRTVGLILLAIVAIGAIPLPYKIACDAQIEPAGRRYVVAPQDGILEKTLVEPGDVVSSGQALASLDEREIQWELAGLRSERNRVARKRDSALAAQEIAIAQLAKLETERLDLKIALLEYQAKNLRIVSPIDGVVISGDLEQVEGAALSMGDSLFEISPLDPMIFELAVPQEDIPYVAEDAEVTIRLDAYPGRKFNGTIQQIHPRSEMRDSQSVFIAELPHKNQDGALLPGMSGTARITGPRRYLAWNLLHKPWEKLVTFLGW